MPMPASPTWSHAVQAGTRSWWSSSAKSLREGDDALNTAVPFSVEAMVADRTSAFPAACRALLAVAAVLGPRFRLDVLADAADVPLADVRDVLDGAERAGIVSFTEPGEGRFAHELVRDSIYGSLPAPERTRRHGEVASVLMRLGNAVGGVGGRDRSHLVLAGTGDAARATDSRGGPVTTPAGSPCTPMRRGGTTRRSGAWISPVARTGSGASCCWRRAKRTSGVAIAARRAWSSAVSRRSRGTWPSRRSSPAPAEPELRVRRLRGRHVRPGADRSPVGSARGAAGRGSGAARARRGASLDRCSR